MRLEDAPRVEDDDGPVECVNCGSEGTMVLFEHDKMCTECHHAPSKETSAITLDERQDQWEKWFAHRDAEYSGWYGENRIKFPGGFASAWDSFDFS